MVDSDEITVNGMAQFVLFCLSKSLLNQLLFVENVINLQTEKKPLDQAKVSASAFILDNHFPLADIQYLLMLVWAPPRSSKFHSL